MALCADAAKALTDFAAVATSRVEASFPADDLTKPVLLERVRARRDLAQARYDYLMAWTKLHYYAGTLNEQDLARVDEAFVVAHQPSP